MTGPVPDPDPRLGLVLEEARRGIDQQVRDLDSIRARAGSLATLALGAGTFLAGVIVNADLNANWATWLGFAFLAAAVVVALVQLWPRTFSLTLDVGEFADLAETDDIDTLLQKAAEGLRADAAKNQKTLDAMLRCYPVAVALFVAGVAFVTASLVWGR